MPFSELLPSKLKINWQATAHGNADGLNPGSSAYWAALEPHRKLDEERGLPSKHVVFQTFGDGTGLWGSKGKKGSSW